MSSADGSFPIKRTIYDYGWTPSSAAGAILAEPGLAAFRDLTVLPCLSRMSGAYAASRGLPNGLAGSKHSP